MEYLIVYLVMALATGFTAWYFIWNPCITEAKLLGIKNDVTLNPTLSGFVYFIVATLTAPVVAAVLILPTNLFNKAVDGTRKITHEETLA